MVKVAIVISDGIPGQGGIAQAMTYLTRYYKAHVSDIIVSVHRARLTDRPILNHLSVPVALVMFAITLIAHRIDVVHINIAPRGSTWRKMLFAKTSRLLGCSVILHLHGSGYNEFYAGLGPRRQRLVRSFFANAGAVVVLSGFWKRFMEEEIGLAAARIEEIANGVPEAVTPTVRQSTVPRIVCLGLVGHRKGTDILLDAFSDLAQRGVAWHASIGGNGEVEAAIVRARELGIADRIDFLGWVNEAKVDQLLRAADVFVLPSRAENQPVAILEAMARSVPVVATTVGGIPEQVVDGETGLLVPPGDAASLSVALASLIQSADRRDAYGRAGLARFQRLFSVEASAERFAALYRSLAR